MNLTKMTIILGAVVLAGVSGYTLYLHQGPLKMISEENQQLAKEVALSKTKAEEMQTTHQTNLAEKMRLVEELQRKKTELEEVISNVRKERQTAEKDLQARINSLQNQLVQREQDIQNFHNQTKQLRQTITNLEDQKNTLSQKTFALEKQLRESRSRLQAFSQDIAFREEKLLAIEKTYDELVRQLNQQIQQKEFQISELEGKLKIRLLDKILFDPGNATITPNGRRVLQNLAKELKKLEGVQISVEGHTDNQPLSKAARDVYHDNLGLSVSRSAAVTRTLRTMGVRPQLLSAAGFSMYRPVTSNATSEGQQQNRRVEIILAPMR